LSRSFQIHARVHPVAPWATTSGPPRPCAVGFPDRFHQRATRLPCAAYLSVIVILFPERALR